jgi:hypothetical protein
MSDADTIAEAERRRIRRAQGLPLHLTAEEEAERIADEDRRLEKSIQRDVRKLYIAHGCTVYWLSQARETGQTAGLGDLLVFYPKGDKPQAWWHEVKSATGKLSPAQEDFRILCNTCQVGHVYGGIPAAEAKLLAIGAWLE